LTASDVSPSSCLACRVRIDYSTRDTISFGSLKILTSWQGSSVRRAGNHLLVICWLAAATIFIVIIVVVGISSTSLGAGLAPLGLVDLLIWFVQLDVLALAAKGSVGHPDHFFSLVHLFSNHGKAETDIRVQAGVSGCGRNSSGRGLVAVLSRVGIVH